MPLVQVSLFEGRLDDAEQSKALIEKLTQALCDVYGEGMREHTTVILGEVAPKNWGAKGVPYA